VREAKARGVRVTAEVCPHHFTLTEEAVRDYDTHAKMNPPLRTERDVAALRAGLADGTIDAIATDHAPHSEDEKRREFDQAPFGIVGLETALPLTLALVSAGVLTPVQAIAKLTADPCRVFGLDRGQLGPGAAADVAIIDPGVVWELDPARMQTRSRNTPFAGWKLTGRAVTTIVGGRVVHSERGGAER
jgi:dihydroorotase